MKYFCAACQKKHDIGEIAADLYEICADDIWENIGMIQNRADVSEETANLFNRLRRFCRTESAMASRYFTLKGNEIESHIKNAVSSGTTVRGNLQLTLGWLADAYTRSGVKQKHDQEEEVESADPKQILRTLLQEPVYNKEFIFTFGEIGKKKERILDHYTDADGNPFGDLGGTLKGYRRVCPYCGRLLSRAVGRAPEIVIALAGSPRAGKTSCMTAIASSLSNGKYAQYGLSMDTFNNDTQWENIKRDMELYEKGYQVVKTPQSISETPSFSLFVRLGNIKRVLTFVDMPGEFFQSGQGLTKEFFVKYAGLYLNIDCIWLFISKLKAYDFDLGDEYSQTEKQKQLSAAANESPEIYKNDTVANFGANMTMLREQLASNGRKMPPTAVILTKTEVDVADSENLERFNLFPVENGRIATNVSSKNAAELRKVLLPDNSNHYRLDEKMFFDAGAKVRQFFARYSPGLLTAIERNCPYRFYIASASYGHYAVRQNEEQGRIPYAPTPYHEMYPLLWTMATNGSLLIIHLCTWAEKGFLGGFKNKTEGAESMMFQAGPYIYYTIEDDGTEETRDKNQILKDIAANLLMENSTVNGVNYQQTDFYHKRK